MPHTKSGIYITLINKRPTKSNQTFQKSILFNPHSRSFFFSISPWWRCWSDWDRWWVSGASCWPQLCALAYCQACRWRCRWAKSSWGKRTDVDARYRSCWPSCGASCSRSTPARSRPLPAMNNSRLVSFRSKERITGSSWDIESSSFLV